MKSVLEEAFGRMGIALDVVHLPSERSLRNADAGVEDGNFVRTAGIKAHPNLVRVPEKLFVNRIVAFSKDRSLKMDGWKGLTPYNVTFVRGWKNCQRNIKHAKSITPVRNEDLMFKLLYKGRADVGIFGKRTGLDKLKEMGIDGIHALDPPIVVSDLFLYMNKRHEGLIPEIVAVLKEMKRDGTYQRLLEEHGLGK